MIKRRKEFSLLLLTILSFSSILCVPSNKNMDIDMNNKDGKNTINLVDTQDSGVGIRASLTSKDEKIYLTGENIVYNDPKHLIIGMCSLCIILLIFNNRNKNRMLELITKAVKKSGQIASSKVKGEIENICENKKTIMCLGHKDKIRLRKFTLGKNTFVE